MPTTWTGRSARRREAFDYLDDGETLTLTYTVRATDDSAASDDQTVTITITGTNDGPVITVGAGDSAAETLAETNAALAISGTLTVIDVDLSDARDPDGVVGGGLRHHHGPGLRQRGAAGDADGDAGLDRRRYRRYQQPGLGVQLDAARRSTTSTTASR